MARSAATIDRRRRMIPIIARAFAQLGYRRATTAELARRCGVRENVLYRLWPDKRAMFIAAIDYVYDLSESVWLGLQDGREVGGRTEAAAGSSASPAERVLRHEAIHQGEFSHYRIIFAGLSETDDPHIRAALARMYQRFARILERMISTHRGDGAVAAAPSPELAAWAVIGLGTVSNIVRELETLSAAERQQLMLSAGRVLLEGVVA